MCRPTSLRFGGALGVGMSVALWSNANIREVLELLDDIEETRFEQLPQLWQRRSHRAINYHPGRKGPRADCVYYEPFKRQKLCRHAAEARASAARFVTEYLATGWSHDDKDFERTPRDVSCDCVSYADSDGGRRYGSHRAKLTQKDVPGGGAGPLAMPNEPQSMYAGGEVAAVRGLLEDAAVVNRNVTAMGMAELHAYVCGRISR